MAVFHVVITSNLLLLNLLLFPLLNSQDIRMDDPDVPSFFICPISLQIMKDPVTISTGMTFDRDSIVKWLFLYHKSICPITRQPLSDHNLTPNSNLLRLIYSWHTQAHHKSAADEKHKPDFNTLIGELNQPHLWLSSLRKIKSFMQEKNDFHLSCMEDASFASLVSSLITTSESSDITKEAMSVLYLMNLSSDTLKKISQDRNGIVISSLSLILLKHTSYRARSQAAVLLKSIFKIVDDIYKVELKAELFDGITEILKDQRSRTNSPMVLSILVEVIPYGKNKAKAVQSGVVPVIVELLAESVNERKVCELLMCVLERLCRRAEGREALLGHPAGMAAVCEMILRVSRTVTERAVRIILSMMRFCQSSEVVHEVLKEGGVAKLCMVLQGNCRTKTKEKAREILGFHLKHGTSHLAFLPCP